MKILVLTKRYTSGKDLLKERFGRAYELARGLAAECHDVHGLAIGYRGEPELSEHQPDTAVKRLSWQALSIRPITPWDIFYRLRYAATKANPDALWCSGDVFQIILGHYLAQRLRIPLFVDLYDNYEAFWITRIPGVFAKYKSIVRNASGVTCVSRRLTELVRYSYKRSDPTLALENGVHADAFTTLSRSVARRSLNLPDNALLIGTAGALRERRGLTNLLEAIKILRQEMPSAELILAGPLDSGASPPRGSGITYLGILPHEQMPAFFRALDVAVICNRNTAFGRYCYPLKLPEIAAAGIPTAVPNLPVMRDIVGPASHAMYIAESPKSLASTLNYLVHERTATLPIPETWQELAGRLSHFINSASP